MNNNNQKAGPLKDELSQLLDADSLSSDELNAIQTIQNSALRSPALRSAEPHSEKENSGLSKNSLAKRYYLSAACALFAIVTFGAVTKFYFDPDTTTQSVANINESTQIIANNIAEEVALNHLTLKPLDKESTIVAELQNYFTQLEFSPFESKYALTLGALNGKRLLGGRYCSIQGVTALQMRYADTKPETNTPINTIADASTLYQVNYNSRVHGSIPNIENSETPIQINQRGLIIQIWLEKGLLMALVNKSLE